MIILATFGAIVHNLLDSTGQLADPAFECWRPGPAPSLEGHRHPRYLGEAQSERAQVYDLGGSGISWGPYSPGREPKVLLPGICALGIFRSGSRSSRHARRDSRRANIPRGRQSIGDGVRSGMPIKVRSDPLPNRPTRWAGNKSEALPIARGARRVIKPQPAATSEANH